MPVTTKRLSKKQLVASLLVESGADIGQAAYVVKTPRADAKHNSSNPEQCVCYGCHKGSSLSMYGVEFTDGVAVLTDDVAKAQTIRVATKLDNGKTDIEERPMNARELAERITAEFPGYTYEELA